jgi:hypothetical protein
MHLRLKPNALREKPERRLYASGAVGSRASWVKREQPERRGAGRSGYGKQGHDLPAAGTYIVPLRRKTTRRTGKPHRQDCLCY